MWVRGILRFWKVPVAVFAYACTSPPADGGRPAQAHSADSRLLELFSWWTAPGEAEALQSLIETHQLQHPGVRTFNAAVASGTDARTAFTERMAQGLPPDLFQANAHDMKIFDAAHPDRLYPLDDFFATSHLSSIIFPELIRDVTIDGKILSMPVNMHRENALFYNKRIFDTYGLQPPTSVQGLLDVCEALRTAKVAPIATSYQGWILRILFSSILAGTLGSEAYYGYFTGQTPGVPPGFRAALATFSRILDSYVNVDATEQGFGWTTAAEALHAGDAAMFFHGDWVKGYLVQLGGEPGVDFDVIAAPGTRELFLYGVDVFAVPRGALNQAGALSFLRTVASTQGQLAFNEVKGSSPMRRGVPSESMDALARRTLSDLENARYRMLVRSLQVWDDALVSYTKDRNVDALVATYERNPPPR